MAKKKVIAFDMDGTLAESRLDKVPDHTKEMLGSLVDRGYYVTILSSGGVDRLYNQLQDVDVHLIGNYGLQEGEIINGKLTVFRQDTISTFALDRLVDYKINKFRQISGYTNVVGRSHGINRSGFLVVFLPGEDLSKEERAIFDPDKEVRKQYYDVLQELFPQADLTIAGKTSYDLVDRKHNKYTALVDYCNSLGCSIDDALFFGDELQDRWGNDYSITRGGVDAVNVNDYRNVADLVEIALELYERGGIDTSIIIPDLDEKINTANSD